MTRSDRPAPMPGRLAVALEQARSWPGLGAHGREPEAYARLLFPNDAEAWARNAARSMSSCALVALAYYRACGTSDPRLRQPYKGRTDAVTQVVTIASAAGAWRTPSPFEPMPQPGDVVVLTGPEHVFIVTGYEADTGALLSIDGGQGPGGTSIGTARRLLVEPTPKEWWCVRPETPYLAGGKPNGRRVLGVASGRALVGG